jgi:hypothetical protein
VVSLSDSRSAEEEATVGWAVVACGLERKLSGESTGHQERSPGCPQQHADQDPAPVNRTWRSPDGRSAGGQALRREPLHGSTRRALPPVGVLERLAPGARFLSHALIPASLAP